MSQKEIDQFFMWYQALLNEQAELGVSHTARQELLSPAFDLTKSADHTDFSAKCDAFRKKVANYNAYRLALLQTNQELAEELSPEFPIEEFLKS